MLGMVRVLDLRGDRSDPTDRLPRASAATAREARETAREVLDAVRAEGDAAVLRYAKRFDRWEGEDLVVPLAAAAAALAALDDDLRTALTRAAERVRWFAARERPRDWTDERDGVRLGVRHRPVRRVGVYVPGGRAVYPSTVLMTVLPARAAGVDEVVLATPPQADGRPDPTILAAAALVGVDRILVMGGAQAIGALAYGTATVPSCDLVVGPGNAYVAAAKLQVAGEGVVGVDAFAGVTEVAVIADATADPRLVAADLVAQAEHDPLVSALLITDAEGLVAPVLAALEVETAGAVHAERVRAALDGQGAVVLVDDLDHAVAVSDAFAPEHLELHCVDAAAVAERVRFAGAVFVGAWSPVALGDYCAGPSHTLPTGGTARFTGGLATGDFLVGVHWIEYPDAAAFGPDADLVERIAPAEDLHAHARSIAIRRETRP